MHAAMYVASQLQVAADGLQGCIMKLLSSPQTRATTGKSHVTSRTTHTCLSALSCMLAGPVGPVTSVTPASEPTPASATSFDLTWVQDTPDAAKTASYELFRYLTGATDATRTAKCTAAKDLDVAAMDGVTQLANGTLQLLDVPLCDGAPNPLDQGRCAGEGSGCGVVGACAPLGEWRGLVWRRRKTFTHEERACRQHAQAVVLQAVLDTCPAACPTAPRRYKIYWTVNGNPSGNSQSLLSDFFYVGARVGPAWLAACEHACCARATQPICRPQG